MSSFPLDAVRPAFRAVVGTVAPRARGFGPDEWDRAERLVAGALADRPEPLVRQLAVFVRVLDWLPVVRYGRRFHKLPTDRRLRTLERLERAPLLAVRRGVWGVRTLSWLAVYGQAPVQAAVGYRPDPGGWDARRRAPAAVEPPEPEGKGTSGP